MTSKWIKNMFGKNVEELNSFTTNPNTGEKCGKGKYLSADCDTVIPITGMDIFVSPPLIPAIKNIAKKNKDKVMVILMTREGKSMLVSLHNFRVGVAAKNALTFDFSETKKWELEFIREFALTIGEHFGLNMVGWEAYPEKN